MKMFLHKLRGADESGWSGIGGRVLRVPPMAPAAGWPTAAG